MFDAFRKTVAYAHKICYNKHRNCRSAQMYADNEIRNARPIRKKEDIYEN